MDHRITELRRAIERAPDDLSLRARLLQARARARDPKLLADFEGAALLLEALSAIAAHHDAFLETPKPGPDGLIFMLDKFERLQRHWSGLPQSLWDNGRQVLEPYLRSRRTALQYERDNLCINSYAKGQAPIQTSIWELAPSTFGDLLFAAWGVRKATRPPLDLLRGLLDEAALLLGHCYRDRDRPHWSFELLDLPELDALEDPRSVAEQALAEHRHAFDGLLNRRPTPFDPEAGRRDPDIRLFPHVTLKTWGWSLNPSPPGPFTPLLRWLLTRAARGAWQRWEIEAPRGDFRELVVNLMRIGRRWYLLKALSEETVIGFLEGEVEV